MSLRISLFKTQKPRQFNYKPLYYDPVKDELAERVNAIKKQQETADKNESEIVREARISKAFRDKRNSRPNTSGIMQQQTFRIVIIATVLAAIAYYLLR